jgi:hypothetical protein
MPISVTKRLNRLVELVTWVLFVKWSGDGTRRHLHRILTLIRRRQINKRIELISALPRTPLRIPDVDGFVTSDLNALGFDHSVVDSVQSLLKEKSARTSASGKSYLETFPLRRFTSESPLIRFALNPAILAVVSDYLGMVPRLTGILLMSSPPLPGPVTGSQLFHCDYEAVRQVKVFVHCSDVGPDDGPLKAIPAKDSQEIKAAIGYKYGGAGFRIADTTIDEVSPTTKARSFEGPEGSVTFIDTSSCLHYGSRMTEGRPARLVVQFQYLRPDAFELAIAPKMRHRPIEVAAQSALERAVLGCL